jgi:DNA-binding NtrC family response regulator
MNTFRMLIVEDDEQVSYFLHERLTGAGYDVKTAATGKAGLALMETIRFDAALVDSHLPDMHGTDVLEAAKRYDSEIDIVVMTGYPEVETAVQALRLGAYDYLIKPLQWVPLHHSIKRIIERRYLRQEVTALRSQLASTPTIDELIGSSPQIRQIKETIAKVATSDTAVLIEGESGTGKELVATAIHKSSARSKGPFVAINCAAVPPDLMESELFGHQKGAFSGAMADSRGLLRSADGGTLFLDELGELPLTLQPKLLRVLQDKEVRPVGSTQLFPVDVRIIAATNQRIETAIQEGRFRQDLYFRLNVVRIEPPPLRQIRSDLPALITHFIRRLNREFGRQVASVAPDAMAALMTYDFPGNIRELENIIERAYALGAQGELKFADLPSLISERKNPSCAANIALNSLDELERELIVATLRNHQNDKEKAAQSLGMSERTLYRRLKKLGVN